MKIDYLGHSGFLVETESVLLLFDYYFGDLSPLDRKPAEKPLYVFVSHAHGDHFDPGIFSLAEGTRPVKYILSFDLRGNAAVSRRADVLYAEADETYDVDGLGSVQTLLSTDAGVAYLVTTQSGTVFHAGDLNWWDWPGEDPAWLAEQETVFQREIGKLAGKRIDAAFVVLDDRLDVNYAKGMAWFLSVCHPSYVLPMHFRKDRSVIERFKALPNALPAGTEILDTTKETSWRIEERSAMKKLLIVIDMQNDFIDGALGTPEAEAVVEAVKDKIRAYPPKDVIATMDTHGPDYLSTQEGKFLPVEHCIKGTEGWQIRPDIAELLTEAAIFEKPTFGSIRMAEAIRDMQDVAEIELVGVCTDICVVSNALLLKACMPEVRISVDASCCAGVTPEKHLAALETMRSCQIVVKPLA